MAEIRNTSEMPAKWAGDNTESASTEALCDRQGDCQVDAQDIVASPGYMLSEQVAWQIFDDLPDEGLMLAIMDREGNCWVNNPEEFSRLNISATLLQEVWSKVDDGVEPVTIQVCGARLTTAQLATEATDCGYLVIVQLRHNGDLANNVELVEAMLHQVNLIASLIEKNNLLRELQTKHYNVYGSGAVPSN